MTDERDPNLYDDADPDAALRRLESLGRRREAADDRGERDQQQAPPPGDRPQVPVARDERSVAAPAAWDARPLPKSRGSRSALAPSRSVRLARLAVPVVFLVAVIAVFSLAWRSGVVGDRDGGAPVASPSPKASAEKTAEAEPTAEPADGSGTKTYTVKPGDTLSGIAARFDTTVTELEDLNADQDLGTLSPGQELQVPIP